MNELWATYQVAHLRIMQEAAMAATMRTRSADRESIPIPRDQHGAKLSRKQGDLICERLKQIYERFEDEPFSPRLREAVERLTRS